MPSKMNFQLHIYCLPVLFYIFLSVVSCQNQTTGNGTNGVSGSFFNITSFDASAESTITPFPLTSSNNSGRPTFTAQIPIHLLPSNQIVDYFSWEVEIGQKTCPFHGMLVRARRGMASLNSREVEDLDDLRNFPSPHCSVECECLGTGDYRCKSVCPPPPNDMDFCVPVAVPGQCCHTYVCDDELDSAFPTLRYPEPSANGRTTLMCMPGSVIPDSVCHNFFPTAFSGHLGPKGICFDYDDIRCAWLDDNEISNTLLDDNTVKGDAPAQDGRKPTQTIFFQTARNGTVFSTDIPLKKSKSRLRRI